MTGPLRFLQTENARLKEENEALRAELTALRDFVMGLSELAEAIDNFSGDGDGIMNILDRLLYHSLEVLDASDGSIILVDDETDELVFVVVHGKVREKLPGYRMPITGVAGWVVTHNEPAIINNVRADPRFSPMVDQAFTFRTESLIAVPLVGDGQVLGVVEAINKRDGTPFEEKDKLLLSLLCRFAGTALAKIAEEEPTR